MNQDRPRAEDFLELVERARRGRLKLYLGFAAGVGKTYRMLQEAHALRQRGVDVVLALIETHGRAETAALIEGLEAVPRRRIEYRGIPIEEMDVDAVLARRPQVAVVDELAHTNVPGCKNRKRYQDVVDLLDAGINVIGAFNIQHLESLNDLVERATGVAVRETVPDSFLKQADQVVSLDLAVEDLLDRLRAGKIYPPDKVPLALSNFFKSENLATLRELSLREVVESLDRQARSAAVPIAKIDGEARSVAVGDRPGAAPERPGDTPRRASSSGQRVMLCMTSHPPRAPALLRRGSRMAGRLNTDWFVVYVETPSEAPHLIDSEAQRHLLDNIQLARDLGAEVVRLQGADPVAALLDFARSHNVGHIIVGRSQRSWWAQVVGRSILLRLVREAVEFDLHIVAWELDEGRP